ncbi:uncharacterized protein [Nicotiana sylvestris]|uniref:uncharacterized protein n=1 Tax=Nicotiana sylvestris TaxID=4096 RepID=UPI00388CE3F6
MRLEFPNEPVVEWKGDNVVPKDREINFGIDVMPGTHPISIPPYRMASAELKELKEQLKDLLERVSSGQVYQRSLAQEVHQLASLGVRLADPNEGGVIVQNRVESSLGEEVKEKQLNDPLLAQLKEGIHKHKNATFSFFMEDGSTKLYHDLKEVYWWNNMKKDVVDFVAKCPNCQQVKAEHQRPDGLAQSIEIPIWKWEMINMDFVVSPIKGIIRFGKKGRLSPRYVRPYRIIQRISQMAYKLELPPEMSMVHPVFHVSILKKEAGDPSTIVPVETIEVNDELSYEEVPVAIFDRQVRKLRNKEIASVKVLW